MSKHVVARASDIAPGERRLVTVKGRPFAIFNVGGEFYGLFNRCPHQGGSLAHGIMTGLTTSRAPGEYCYARKGEMVRCPWHGWEFDVKTGKSYCDPEKYKTRTVQVEIEPGVIVAEGPYVAETVNVSVEEDYVVVEL